MASSRELFPIPSLAVEKLQLSDVENIFHLVQTTDVNWAPFRVPFELPDDCAFFLNMIDTSVSQADGEHEVALRLRLAILIAAVYSTSPDQRTPDLKPVPLSAGHRFSFEPVVHEGEIYRLQGVPEFSLWYIDSFERDNAAGSPFAPSFYSNETKSYQGMIHRQRDDENSVQHVIFGLSTDHDQFHFVRLSGQGKWSRQDIPYSHRQQIIETLAYIHKQASILSVWEGISESRESCSGTRTNRSLVSDKTWSRFKVDDPWTQESKEDDTEFGIDY